MKIIKDFECYSKKQRLAKNQTQWEKQFADGQTATLVIDDSIATRANVRKAFKIQESGQNLGCFLKADFD